jgi:predicted nuclease with TOPRIM domain
MSTHNQQLKNRLDQLRREYEEGQKMLAELDQKRANLRDTLLRISGAIQVLEETLGEATGEDTTLSDAEEATAS